MDRARQVDSARGGCCNGARRDGFATHCGSGTPAVADRRLDHPAKWGRLVQWWHHWAMPQWSRGRPETAVLQSNARIRAIIGAGLQLVALSLSACSPGSSAGTSLPISVGTRSGSVHPSSCTLNSSGTRAVAAGTFKPLPTLPIDPQGQQVGLNELLLRVDSLGTVRVGRLVVHNPAVGQADAGVSIGQDSWRLVTNVESMTGVKPNRCVVTLQRLGAGVPLRGSDGSPFGGSSIEEGVTDPGQGPVPRWKKTIKGIVANVYAYAVPSGSNHWSLTASWQPADPVDHGTCA